MGRVLEGDPGDPGPKNDEFFFLEKVFYSIRKSHRTGRGPGKKIRKNSKIFDSTNYRPGRTGPAPARPGPASGIFRFGRVLIQGPSWSSLVGSVVTEPRLA